MHFIHQLAELTVNINQHLTVLVYGLVALIIFCEVGLVVAHFLPGDSMLFAIGTLCASEAMDLATVLILLSIAAILGDNFNRLMGIWVGHKAFAGRNGRFFNQKNLDRAHYFFEKYGAKAVTVCRFFPLLRNGIPFVAGMAEMRLRVFFPYSVLGGTGWVVVCVLAGYFFGNLDLFSNLSDLRLHGSPVPEAPQLSGNAAHPPVAPHHLPPGNMLSYPSCPQTRPEAVWGWYTSMTPGSGR
ncbi:MAG: VTT domain-containing protein [Desulfobulbus sp.]|nr:VTT domain-containing protein [Desulfobulbus sp.]